MRRKHRSAKQWEHIIDDWQNSDLSVSQFCRDQKIPTSVFYRWKMKLGQQKDHEQNPFVQVKWPATTESIIELALNAGHVLRFDGSTDKTMLVSALAALKEVGLC